MNNGYAQGFNHIVRNSSLKARQQLKVLTTCLGWRLRLSLCNLRLSCCGRRLFSWCYCSMGAGLSCLALSSPDAHWFRKQLDQLFLPLQAPLSLLQALLAIESSLTSMLTLSNSKHATCTRTSDINTSQEMATPARRPASLLIKEHALESACHPSSA